MAGAAQTALGIAQLSQRTMENVARSVEATLQRGMEQRKMQADIYSGLIRSAQADRQQEIDTYFKGKQLALEGRKMELDASMKRIGYALEDEQLKLYKDRLDIDRRSVEIRENEVKKNESVKPYTESLKAFAARKQAGYKSEIGVMEQEISMLEAREKNMTTAQRLLDKQSGETSVRSRLESLSRKKLEMVQQSEQEIGAMFQEAINASATGVIGTFYNFKEWNKQKASENQLDTIPLPGVGTSGSSLPVFDSSATDNGPNPLLPNANGGFRDVPQSEIDAAQKSIGVDPEQAKKERAFLEVPKMNLMALPREGSVRIGPDGKEVINEEKPFIPADELIPTLLDKGVDVKEIPELLSFANDETKAIIAKDFRPKFEQEYLTFIGQGSSYNLSKDIKDEEGIFKNIVENMTRIGVPSIDIIRLKAEAGNKMNEFRAEFLNKVPADQPQPTQGEVDNYVAMKYDQWILDRYGKSVSDAKGAEKATGPTTSVKYNFDVGGKTVGDLGDEDFTRMFTPDEVTNISGDNKIKLEQERIDKFRDSFIVKEGKAKGQIKAEFLYYLQDNLDKLPQPPDPYKVQGVGGETKADRIKKLSRDVKSKGIGYAFSLFSTIEGFE